MTVTNDESFEYRAEPEAKIAKLPLAWPLEPLTWTKEGLEKAKRENG